MSPAMIALIFRLLDLTLVAIPRISAYRADVEAIREDLRAMIAEGREPTEEEWEAVGRRTDERLARLRAQVGE